MLEGRCGWIKPNGIIIPSLVCSTNMQPPEEGRWKLHLYFSGSLLLQNVYAISKETTVEQQKEYTSFHEFQNKLAEQHYF